MSTAREEGAGVFDPQHGFVLTGGRDNDNNVVTSSSERTDVGVTFFAFPALPFPVYGHCIVSLNNGGDLGCNSLEFCI